MIIRKPYAFIVKYYRIIHLLLLIPLLYIAFKSYRLMDFFHEFVADGYKTSYFDVAKYYYNFLVTLFPFIIFLFNLLIVILFSNKKKGYFTYLIITLFYLGFFVISFLMPGILTSFETKEIESAIALMVNGISGVIFYIQPFLIIIFTLNGFGFNFKTFEFTNIKDEISLDEEDSEEIELNVNISDYRFKRGIRRYFREIKYYIIENKMFFLAFSSIVGLVLLFFIGKWVISLNRIVRVDKTFAHSSFSVSFNDSVLSTLDYNGNTIQNGKVFLAVKTTIKNNTKGLIDLDTDAFWLNIDGKYYYPVLDRSGKFLDIGKPYYGEKIGSGVQEEIVLVYEFDDNEVASKYKIRVLDSLTYKEESVIPKYKEITLKPDLITSVKTKGNYNLGDTINLKDTNLLNTSLTINKYNIDKTYQYHYDYCYNDKCSDSINSITAGANKTILALNGKIEIDDKASYFKNKMGSNKFAQDFIKIEYTVNDKTSISNIKDLTPSNTKDEIVLFEVDNEVRKADKINMVITIRNIRYILKIK